MAPGSVILVADDPGDAVEALSPEIRPIVVRSLEAFAHLAELDRAGVAIVAEHLLGAHPVRDIETVRRRAPNLRVILLTANREAERLRELVTIGPVIPLPLDAERLRAAVKHAETLGAMANKVDRMRQTGRFTLTSIPPPPPSTRDPDET